MIRFVSILIAVLLLGQSVNKTAVYLNYLANREFISKNYCENRTNVQLHCNGKCHLQKQMNKQDGQTPFSPKNVLGAKEIAEFDVPSKRNEIAISAVSIHLFSVETPMKTTGHQTDVFHPPCI